jgi:hypothetical protein
MRRSCGSCGSASASGWPRRLRRPETARQGSLPEALGKNSTGRETRHATEGYHRSPPLCSLDAEAVVGSCAQLEPSSCHQVLNDELAR